MRGRKVTKFVLDQMQMLYQKITSARAISQKGFDLVPRGIIQLTAFGRLATFAAPLPPNPFFVVERHCNPPDCRNVPGIRLRFAQKTTKDAPKTAKGARQIPALFPKCVIPALVAGGAIRHRRRMKRVVFIACLLASTAASAETPMSAEAFEAYTSGKTLFFAESGSTYGIEEYLSNRRVRWSYLDGECQDGHWYPSGDMICFEYENIAEPQCWRFFERPGGLSASFGSEPGGTQLYETLQSSEPMMCLGPKIGV